MDFTKEHSFYRFVTEFMEHLSTQNKMQDIRNLKTEAEYFSYIWNLPKLHSLLEMNSAPTQKSDKIALSAKEDGNRLYKAGDLIAAQQMYSKAMIYATGEQGADLDNNCNLLAKCAANRSAVLYQQQKYSNAVVDIEYAIEAGYPSEMIYKLHERRARCLIGLHLDKEAVTYFNTAIETLKESNLTDDQISKVTDGIQEEIDNCQKRIQLADQENKNDSEICTINKKINLSPPSVSGGENSDIPTASASLNLSFSSSVGRYATAKANIKIGDALIVEKPFVSVLKVECLATHCFHCFSRLETLYPCETCTLALFCSSECYKEAVVSYHTAECPYFPYFVKSGCGNMGFLALRLAIISGFDQILSSSKSLTSSSGEVLKSNASYDFICTLVTNACSRSSTEMLQYCVLSSYVLNCLERVDNWIPQDCNDEKLVIIGAMIMKNLMSIACNGIETTEYVEGSKEPDFVGLGLFPVVSLLNHSCDPSCELVFYGKSCVVYSLKDLKPKEEICIDYGYVYYLSNRKTRQGALKTQYKFHCACVACTNDWPTKTKFPNQPPRLLCSKCGAVISTRSKNKQGYMKCFQCGKVTDYDKTLVVLQMAQAKYKNTLDDHIRFVQLLQRLLAQPNKIYATAIWEMRKAFQRMVVK